MPGQTRLPTRSRIRLRTLLALAVAMAGAPDAFAQKAALTKDVDQVGRAPYEVYIEFNRFGCSLGCTNFSTLGSVIQFDGPVVPAGKRLVLQWVSARLPGNDGYNSLALLPNQIFSAQFAKWSFNGPFFAFAPGAGLYGMSSAAFATYGPGESPHVNVFANSLSNYTGNVNLAGYLIDAAN